jgi:hypothetical protein
MNKTQTTTEQHPVSPKARLLWKTLPRRSSFTASDVHNTDITYHVNNTLLYLRQLCGAGLVAKTGKTQASGGGRPRIEYKTTRKLLS